MKKNSFQHYTWLLAIGFIFFWNSGFIGAEFGLPFTKPLTLLLFLKVW